MSKSNAGVSLSALQARLEALEAENKALREGSKASKVEIITQYDKPFLNFTGNFKPFAISVQKAGHLSKFAAEIEAFAKSGGKSFK